MTSTDSVCASTIHCPNVPATNLRNGRNASDDMLGTAWWQRR